MIKVKLRQKEISAGKQSLYLDFYPAIKNQETGKYTRREFLGLYILDKPRTSAEKQHNKELESLANEIKRRRESELNKPEIYTGYELEQLRIKQQSERSFIEYFDMLTEKRKSSNYDNWVSAAHYLKKFTGSRLRFADLSAHFCNSFKEYLLTTKSNKRTTTKLSQNSAVAYFNKFKAALKQAYKDGYLQHDLNAKVTSIRQAETQIEFLTMEELNKLANTECPNPLLKRAALFSAQTGMAFKEIQNLTWSDVQHSLEYGYYIPHKRQKTGSNNYLPISEQAYQHLGERGEPTDRVFPGLNNRDRYYHFHVWLAKAGVTNINFHGLRHTYATLLLSLGTDIYTVSKMMDHKNVRTTQVYGKVINATKRKAADLIQLDI